MDRDTRVVVGLLAGILATCMAFGLYHVLRTLASCACLNSSPSSAPLF